MIERPAPVGATGKLPTRSALAVTAANGALLGLCAAGVIPLFATITAALYLDGLAAPLALAAWGTYGAATGRVPRRAAAAAVLAAVGILVLLGYATVIEPHALVVREVVLTSPHVDDEVRLLHVSDIQADAVGGYQARVVARINALHPDLVVHTGDLIQTDGDRDAERRKLSALLRAVSAPYGVYLVEGDTDAPGEPWLERFDAAAGTVTLHDRQILIDVRGNRVALTGLSLESSAATAAPQTRTPAWPRLLAATARHRADLTVWAGHRPDYLLAWTASPVKPELALAGHTHGGQVRLPFYGPLLTLSRVPRAWARGFREVAGVHVDVSAGIGVEHAGGLPPLRFNCPPEMTLIRILPAH